MRLNATFFIQIINFGITYWFLNKFMFKPVIDFLKKKKSREDRTERSLYEKEQLLLYLEGEKHQELKDFRVGMKKRYKFVLPKIFKIPTDVPYNVNTRDAEEIIKVATQVLVKRVPHVD